MEQNLMDEFRTQLDKLDGLAAEVEHLRRTLWEQNELSDQNADALEDILTALEDVITDVQIDEGWI